MFLVMIVLAWAKYSIGMFSVLGPISILILSQVAGVIAAWLVYGRRHRQLTRLVAENDSRVCLRCGYLLTGLPDRHSCPECGVSYDVEENRRLWERWVNGTSEVE